MKRFSSTDGPAEGPRLQLAVRHPDCWTLEAADSVANGYSVTACTRSAGGRPDESPRPVDDLRTLERRSVRATRSRALEYGSLVRNAASTHVEAAYA